MASRTKVNALVGSDTIQVGGRVLTCFAEGDVAQLEYPAELMAVKTGKNGNSIYALNNMGKQAKLTVRILRGSVDDKFLLGLLWQMKNDPPSFVLLDGYFVKRVGDGNGNVISDTFFMSGGAFSKQPAVQENAEGGTDQGVTIWEILFSNADRGIQ